MIKTFTIESKGNIEFIDITRIIEEAIDENIEEGLCHIYTPHTTAGLTINENYDPNVHKDIINTLNKLIPENS
ncbi:MAG: secondary thiamine-phosphate synthase enzyme YjbQ, partial [Candidatus Methanomethylicia archaeon]